MTVPTPPNASPSTRDLDAGSIDVTLSSPEGKQIKYTLNGVTPTLNSSGPGIFSLSGSGIITIPNDHTILNAIAYDETTNEVSEVAKFQYDTEVEVILHPDKQIYEYGDVITATLNTLSGGDIQTYEDYRWNNEQVEHRFDQQEDDDRFFGPRPTFKLNKIGKFRIKAFYKDFGFKSKRKDRLFEVLPKLRIKYKGLETDKKIEDIKIVEEGSDIPFLGVRSEDIKDIDMAGEKPTPPGGLPSDEL
jgi:hypothetical protein